MLDTLPSYPLISYQPVEDSDAETQAEEQERPTAPVNVYPNPVSTSCQVALEQESSYQLQLFSLSGRLLRQEAFSGREFRLDVSQLPGGEHILVLSNGSQISSTRLIIKH